MYLYVSEKRVMDILWKNGAMPAGKIAKIAAKSFDWNRNTTYTVIKKCIEKGYIERIEPNYTCVPKLAEKTVQLAELSELLNEYFDGSSVRLLNALLSVKQISKFEANEMRRAIKDKSI